VRLSYLLALRRLGYRVHFVEQIAREACVDANGAAAPYESSANQAYFTSVMNEFGLSECATLLPTDEHGGAAVPRELLKLADSAAVLLNISGHLAIEPLLQRFRRKVLIDIDPGFTQYWYAAGNGGARLAGHDWYFTIGENIGTPECPIPLSGISWHRTRPPAVLSEWPVTPAPQSPRFTTIANWRGSYGTVQFGGQTFGLKVHEFRKVAELPSRVSSIFEIALNIHPGDHKDLAALKANGWQITDPLSAAATPSRFRRYVQESGAEFSVAQGIYVETNSGWFSDRSVRYLASGKPVLVQETGFSRNLPVGEGLVAFRTLDEAAVGARRIKQDYDHHCRAARALAEEYFDSDKVLRRLLDEVGVST
jgi:hypothetical protein